MACFDLALHREVEQFLYREARLLDEGNLHAWLELLTDDVRYLMPAREVGVREAAEEVDDQALAFRLYDEDKKSLTMRVARLDTGMAHVETPPSITVRQITNVELVSVDDQEVTVRSNYCVYQSRLDKLESTFYGSRRDTLRKANGEWKLARRKIMLAHPVLPRTISIFF